MPEDADHVFKTEQGLDPLGRTLSDGGESEGGDAGRLNENVDTDVDVNSLLDSSTEVNKTAEVEIITLESGDESDAESLEMHASEEGVAVIKKEPASDSETEVFEQNPAKDPDNHETGSEASTNDSEESRDSGMSEEVARDATNHDDELDVVGGVVDAPEAVDKVMHGGDEEAAEGSKVAEKFGWGWLEEMAMGTDDRLFYDYMVSYCEGYYRRELMLFFFSRS